MSYSGTKESAIARLLARCEAIIRGIPTASVHQSDCAAYLERPAVSPLLVTCGTRFPALGSWDRCQNFPPARSNMTNSRVGLHRPERTGAPARPYQKSKSDGIALIITLAMLVLISAVVVGMLSLATSERKASSAYAQGVETRSLAESAAEMAIGQIRAATSNLHNNKTWASQPGMIRVYSADQGNPGSIYKLYSSDTMVVDNTTSFAQGSDLPSGTWNSSQGVYTDLNEPMAIPNSGGSTLLYPIIDGNGLDGTGTYSDGSGTPQIEGFAVKNAPLASDRVPNQVPMPVKWLYVLKDGTYIAPDNAPANGGRVTFTGSAVQPTAQNYIVGRVAFWTDDETCKVNINTAGESKMWCSPKSNTRTDYPGTSSDSWGSYANASPAVGEYAQYPGHPAATCLSTVLGNWLPIGYPPTPWGTSASATTGYSSATSFTAGLQSYLGDSSTAPKNRGIAPRLQFGGSKGGTAAPGTATINPDIDRLYASVDELFFDPASANPRTPNQGFADTSGNPSDILEKTKFFLTASSRAPDVTVFNTPRVSLWPIQQDQKNATDKLQMFCSTVNGFPFYFQRLNSANSGAFAQSSSGMSKTSAENTTMDASIGRNAALCNYLQTMAQLPVPGFSQNGSQTLQSKYQQKDTAQIVTSMFDYIRSNVNTVSPVAPFYTYASIVTSITTGSATGNYFGFGANTVVPSQLNGVNGFGRFPTIVEAALVFYANHYINDTLTGASLTATTNVDANNLYVRAVLLLQPFTVSPYAPSTPPYATFVFSGGAVGSMQFPAKNAVLSAALWNAGSDLNGNMPMKGLFSLLNDPGGQIIGRNPYPFISSAMVIPNSAQTFPFSGGTFNISITPGWGTSQTVQTLALNFPGGSFPVPKVASTNATGYPGTTDSNGLDFSVFQNRIEYGIGKGSNSGNRRGYIVYRKQVLVQPEDVVRTIRAATGPNTVGGDYRMIAALPNVPATYFTTGPRYASGVRQDISLRTDIQSYRGELGHIAQMGVTQPPDSLVSQTYGKDTGTTYTDLPDARLAAGSLVGGFSNLNYSPYAPPYVPQGMQGALNYKGLPGDWDNGMSFFGDGPFINPPDAVGGGVTGYSSPNGAVSGSGYISAVPTRQVASAVMFGSLPTGVYGNSPGAGGTFTPHPWQTLLFCPNPPSRTTGATSLPTPQDHFGFANPPDHLWLDFYNMPVVQPYAISEPLSTAGRINMNYQIEPFNYITRSTGVRAVLKGTRICAFPMDAYQPSGTGLSAAYCKEESGPFPGSTATTDNDGTYNSRVAPSYPYELYYDVNRDETIKGFENRFSQGDIFHSASEICSIFLVPQKIPNATYTSGANAATPTYTNMMTWWQNFRLTGDNTREEPYNHLYPRLTTKSNTYRIHVRAQALLQVTADRQAAVWKEGTDQVLGEYRGSFLVERYVDPNDAKLATVDFAASLSKSTAATGGVALDDYYKFRVLERKQFGP